jgi:hypothetical protein
VAQLVEHNLAKVGVAGSNPVVRSNDTHRRSAMGLTMVTRSTFVAWKWASCPHTATWPSGKAEACKAFIPGSNPGVASIQSKTTRRDSPPGRFVFLWLLAGSNAQHTPGYQSLGLGQTVECAKSVYAEYLS